MFATDAIYPLIRAEKEMLEKIQKDDGSCGISWQWYTDYKEFETARDWWRPRLTLDKLLFFEEKFKSTAPHRRAEIASYRLKKNSMKFLLPTIIEFFSPLMNVSSENYLPYNQRICYNWGRKPI